MTTCTHAHTSNRFGGDILCLDCQTVIGVWKTPQLVADADISQEGIVTLSSPQSPFIEDEK